MAKLDEGHRLAALWQALPEELRLSPHRYLATNSPQGPWWVLGWCERVPEADEVLPAPLPPYRVLTGLVDRFGRTQTFHMSASYVGEDNERKVPVMIHRAILGSMERFIGILTEEFAGFFPTWLAPVQVVIMNITDSQSDYVNELTQKLSNAGIRVKADLRNEKIGFKIREHTLRRVPYMLVCGDKEVESGKVAVRTRRGKDLGSMDVNEVIEKLQQEIRSRSLKQLEE